MGDKTFFKNIFKSLVLTFFISTLTTGFANPAFADLWGGTLCPSGLVIERLDDGGVICAVGGHKGGGGGGGALVGPIAEAAYSANTALVTVKTLLFSVGIGGVWDSSLKTSIQTELLSFQTNVAKLQVEILDNPNDNDSYDNEAALQLASSSIRLGSASQAFVNAVNLALSLNYLSQGNKSSVEYAFSPVGQLLEEIARKSVEIWRRYHPIPTATLIADPSTVKKGSASVLYWWSSNADKCELHRQLDSNEETVCNSQASCARGAKIIYDVRGDATYGTRYSLRCSGTGGWVYKETTIYTSSSLVTPVISKFSVEPDRIYPGDSATFKWEVSNASACSIQPLIGQVCDVTSPNNNQSLAGCGGGLRTKEIRNIQEGNTYYLYCDNSTGGSIRSTGVQLTVNTAPFASISANPSSISPGSSTILSWLAANVSSCSIDQSIGEVCNSADACRRGGIKSVSPRQTTTYTISCQGPAGNTQAMTTITVRSPSSSSGGTLAYSQADNFYGDTYYLTITGAPPQTRGTLYKRENGGDWRTSANWVTTDNQGNARKPSQGTWTCMQGDPEEVEIYIKWENGSETNHATHTCRERGGGTATTAPRINSLSPTSGPIGAEVVVSGANLDSSLKILFGGNIEVSLFDVSSSSAKFYVPSGLKQAANGAQQSCSDPNFNVNKLVVAGTYQVSIKNGDPANKVVFEVTPKTLAQLADDLASSVKASQASSEATNLVKNAIACAQGANQLETLIDSYLTKATFKGSGSWDETSWGRRWLSNYSVYLLAIRAYENRGKMSDVAREKMRLILADAIKDQNIVYDRCGQESGNSCAEDYVAVVMTAAAGQLFDVSDSVRETTERAYLSKMFSLGSTNSSIGLVKEVEIHNGEQKEVVKMYNHGVENPVYAGLLFVHLNNAAYAYWLKQGSLANAKPNLPPYYTQYKESAMKPLFQWIQERANGGSLWVDDKGDPIAGAPPSGIPAGRFVRAFLGDDTFLPGKYTFEEFAPGTGGNYDIGRREFYDAYNRQWKSQFLTNQLTASLWAEYPTGTRVTQVPQGTAVIMNWSSTNASRCDKLAGAGFETNGAPSGSDVVSPLNGTTTFSIRCTDSSGGSVQTNYTVGIRTGDAGNPPEPGSPRAGSPRAGSPPAGAPGTYTLYLELGHFQNGINFVEDRSLTQTEKLQFKVEIWTQPTSTYGFGRKVTEGQLGEPISLSPGSYQAVLRGTLPSPYNTSSQFPPSCVFFVISQSQQAGITCTLRVYDKNDVSNYNLPSQERPSGAPPMIEVDSSLGSYQFVKNVVDMSADAREETIVSAGFLQLYNKKVMLVGTRKIIQTSPSQYRYEYKLSIYDVTNPFSPQLLKENVLPTDGVGNLNKSAMILGGGGFGVTISKINILDNLPFIYGFPSFGQLKAGYRPVFVKINSDWSLGEIQEFKIENKPYAIFTLFRGLDSKPYALGFDVSGGNEKELGEKFFGCKDIKILDLSGSSPTVVGEIKESELGLGHCMSGVDYAISKSIKWGTARVVRFSNQKLYLIVPTTDAVGRLHVVERSWVSVFDVSNPSQPRFVGIWQMSGLNNQLHFPDASGAEKAKIYADAGLIEIDSATGYVYDIFPHMYDFQNAAYMTNGEAVNAFNKIPGPWRYRNGIIVRKLNESGNFDFISRFTLCEVEGGEPAGSNGGSFHRVECGDQSEWWGQVSFDKAFYGIGGYITLSPSVGAHAYNGLLLLRDLNKSAIVTTAGQRGFGGGAIKQILGAPAVVGIMVGDTLKIIPDNSDELLKFKDSLSRANFSDNYGSQDLLLRDKILGFYEAHLQQVNDKTFAIFQIHGSSIDVTKLTLTQSRPMLSASPQTTQGLSPLSPLPGGSASSSPSRSNFRRGSYTQDFWRRYIYGY